MKRAATDAPTAPKRPAPQSHNNTKSDAYAQGTGIASLPTSAMSLVWSYAVSMKTSDDVCANAEHQVIQMQTHDLQLVCRTWREAMQLILREKLRGVAVVDVVQVAKAHGGAGGTTTPLVLELESFDKVSPVTDVRVMMGDLISGEDVNDRGIWTDGEQPLIAVRMQRNVAFHKTQPEIDWEATLKPHGDKITRLDLSHMLLYSHHLGSMLRAAAKVCPNVKALILPPAEKKLYRNEETRTDNLDALSTAMRAWHKSNGGLTHLRVPFLGLNNLVSSVLFVNAVTQFCPEIEHIDGWRFTFIEQANLEFITCDDYWLSPPELFSRLWETCTKLKSFNSVVLPFSEEYYAELGEVDKPHMEELVLSYNSLTSNPSREVDSELFLAIPERMPALRKLTVTCGENHEEEWKAGDVFDDAFFLAVAKHCPKLEKLTVKSFADLEKLTVASLAALLAMDALNDVHIRSMLELDDSFIDLLAQRMERKKDLRLRLTVLRMRDTIWKVLALIAEMKTEQFNGVSLSLSLKTHEAFGFVIAKGDNENARRHEIDHVRQLVDEIQRVHGATVRVHLHTTLPPEGHDSKCVLFDSLELGINDPQGFRCSRDKYVECGMETIDQELCGDDIRKSGVFERDADGVLEEMEEIMYRAHRKGRQLFYPDLLSDDDNHEFGFGYGSDDDEFDDGLVYVRADDDGEGIDDDEDDDEDDDDEDGGDIFGNGEEDE